MPAVERTGVAKGDRVGIWSPLMPWVSLTPGSSLTLDEMRSY
jgi:hypothetical protein